MSDMARKVAAAERGGDVDDTAGWVEAVPVRSGGGKSRRVVLKPAKIMWDMEPLHVQCVGVFFGVPVFFWYWGWLRRVVRVRLFQPFDDFLVEGLFWGIC